MYLKEISSINIPDATLDICSDRYQLGVDVEKTGQLIQGQALYIAKNLIKANPSGGTWKEYCSTLVITPQRTGVLIDAYKTHQYFAPATETNEFYVEPSLPTSANKIAVLKGSNPEEKKANHIAIKQHTKKVNPTVADIKSYNNINKIERAVTEIVTPNNDNTIKKSLRKKEFRNSLSLNPILNEKDNSMGVVVPNSKSVEDWAKGFQDLKEQQEAELATYTEDEEILTLPNSLVSPVLDVVEQYVLANESLYEGTLCEYRTITFANGSQAKISLVPTIIFM